MMRTRKPRIQTFRKRSYLGHVELHLLLLLLINALYITCPPWECPPGLSPVESRLACEDPGEKCRSFAGWGVWAAAHPASSQSSKISGKWPETDLKKKYVEDLDLDPHLVEISQSGSLTGASQIRIGEFSAFLIENNCIGTYGTLQVTVPVPIPYLCTLLPFRTRFILDWIWIRIVPFLKKLYNFPLSLRFIYVRNFVKL